MNRKATWDKIKKEQTSSLYELYHDNSKGNLFWNNRRSGHIFDLIEYKKHNSLPLPYILEKALPEIALKANGQKFAKEIYSDSMLGYLSLLLQEMYGYNLGQNEKSLKRVVHSQNDIFPLEIYFYADNIEGIKNGLWHYNVEQSKISLIKYCNISDIENHIPIIKTDETQIIIFITSLMNLPRALQGERAYRNALIETGKVLQSTYQFSQDMNVTYSELNYFNEYAIEEILDIDGINHMLLSGCLLGVKNKKNGKD